MLRWKTISALCTIVISVCPLTSFAQQIAMPEQQTAAVNRALRPLTGANDGSSTVSGVASPDVVIRAPFVQPHNPYLYLFVVENVGSVDATVAAVDLYVPQGVTIAKVSPTPLSSDAQWVHVRLTDLVAGAKSIIEVEISPTSNAVEFSTRLALESVQTFSTNPNANYQVAAKPNPAALPTATVKALLQQAALQTLAEDSKYLIPEVQASHVASLRPVAAKNVHAVQRQAAESIVPASQAAVDAKLLKTVKSLRLAGQDALADAYLAAVANSKTRRAETFE